MVRYLFFGATALAALACLYFFHIQINPSDMPFYRKLVRESIDLHAHSALEKSPIRQLRKGVCKDIWTTRDGKPVHGRITSAKSDMTISQRGEKIAAMEVLQEIEGWIQSDEPTRHMTAESGTCHFPSCLGIANHLLLDLEETKCFFVKTEFQKKAVQFPAPLHIGHGAGRLSSEKGTLDLRGETKQLFLEEGVFLDAPHIPLSITSTRALAKLPRDMHLRATSIQDVEFREGVEIQNGSQIRAVGDLATVHGDTLQLFPQKNGACFVERSADRIDAQEIRFDRRTNELLCLFPHGTIQKMGTFFDADTGRAQFFAKKLQPQTLLLEGNVQIASHLQGKASFAMADSASLQVPQKKIVLESAPGKRVFFRQDGLDVSASTVHIQEAIQGFGDVRFFFYPEEKSVLESIFSKHIK
jgi:hypothetical protein